MNIAIIGAGNGGQAFAGYLAMQGHQVSLYARSIEKLGTVAETNEISLCGLISGTGKLYEICNNISITINNAEVIFVVTTANAHEEIAKSMSPFLQDGQTIVLCPGRTCGAHVFRRTLLENGCKAQLYLAEAQTLVFACRLISPGQVNIIGVKEKVLVAGLPQADTDIIIKKISLLFPCFIAAENTIQTSLENIGAILHSCITLLNAAAIDRGEFFYFYRDVTECIANFIEKVDNERLAIGRAYGVRLLSVREWISFAYPDTKGNSFCELIRNNPGYHDIIAPSNLFVRQITEDIPTGIVPMIELASAVQVETPALSSIVSLTSILVNVDFRFRGRTLARLGLNGKSWKEIKTLLANGK